MREEAEKIPPVKARIDATYNFRLNESKDGASLAERPHQFREHYIINDNSKNKVIIPAVSSERREYIPIGYVNKDTIISNSALRYMMRRSGSLRCLPPRCTIFG